MLKTIVLFETPHIKFRKYNNCNCNIDYTAADIYTHYKSGLSVVRSYYTDIGVFIQYNNKQYYIESYYSYSATTIKHKIKARSIASYNNCQRLEASPEALEKIINTSDQDQQEATIKTILKETTAREKILKEIQEAKDQNRSVFYKDKNLYKYIEARKAPESVTYKNGNSESIYYYKTTFKYLSDIYYHVRKHAYKTKLKTGSSKPGKARTGATYNKYKHKVVITSY